MIPVTTELKKFSKSLEDTRGLVYGYAVRAEDVVDFLKDRELSECASNVGASLAVAEVGAARFTQWLHETHSWTRRVGIRLVAKHDIAPDTQNPQCMLGVLYPLDAQKNSDLDLLQCSSVPAHLSPDVFFKHVVTGLAMNTVDTELRRASSRGALTDFSPLMRSLAASSMDNRTPLEGLQRFFGGLPQPVDISRALWEYYFENLHIYDLELLLQLQRVVFDDFHPKTLGGYTPILSATYVSTVV